MIKLNIFNIFNLIKNITDQRIFALESLIKWQMRVVSCQRIWKGVRREVGDERKGKKGILGIKWKVWDLNLARFIPKVCSFFSS